jgi:redox-sensitive bicupin YhaK (pirin superfamily)
MKTVFHSADSRGFANHGWLKAAHSFSFASWYNPERVHFGMLRVLNDDIIGPGAGFAPHPHDNMEIVTIPLSGVLVHEDRMGGSGHKAEIRAGEVQSMTAGYGITHAEHNGSRTEELRLLQIWVFPAAKDLDPQYDQQHFAVADREGRFQTVAAPVQSIAQRYNWLPEGNDVPVRIHQKSWFSLTRLRAGAALPYSIKGGNGQGAYVFVIEGSVTVGNQTLNRRDALGISACEAFTLSAATYAEVLVIEVPMR